MKERLYLINLYDFYSQLLTKKQCIYFKDYYFNNLSLREISDNNNVSRNAIFKNIKETSNKLKDYEKKLRIYQKTAKIKQILDDNVNIKESIIKILDK